MQVQVPCYCYLPFRLERTFLLWKCKLNKGWTWTLRGKYLRYHYLFHYRIICFVSSLCLCSQLVRPALSAPFRSRQQLHKCHQDSFLARCICRSVWQAWNNTRNARVWEPDGVNGGGERVVCKQASRFEGEQGVCRKWERELDGEENVFRWGAWLPREHSPDTTACQAVNQQCAQLAQGTLLCHLRVRNVFVPNSTSQIVNIW